MAGLQMTATPAAISGVRCMDEDDASLRTQREPVSEAVCPALAADHSADHNEPHRETTMSSTDTPFSENASDLTDSANAAAQQVADAAKTAAAQAGDAIEASVERIRELNEQAIRAARTAGQNALDAYQAALESVVDAEQKLAQGSQLDWFTTLVTTQAEFTQRLGTIFLTAAREQLK